jgi:hypothetical protein
MVFTLGLDQVYSISAKPVLYPLRQCVTIYSLPPVDRIQIWMASKPKIIVNRFADPDPSIFDPVASVTLTSLLTEVSIYYEIGMCPSNDLHPIRVGKGIVFFALILIQFRDSTLVRQREKFRISSLSLARVSAILHSAIDIFKSTKTSLTSTHN